MRSQEDRRKLNSLPEEIWSLIGEANFVILALTDCTLSSKHYSGRYSIAEFQPRQRLQLIHHYIRHSKPRTNFRLPLTSVLRISSQFIIT